jgi:hypothetical protein
VTTRAPSAIPVLLSICLPTLAHGQDPSDQSVQAGRALAIKICTACHIVSADQPFRPILRRPAPEFRAIASRQTTTAQSLRSFLSTTHTTISAPYKMPSPELTGEMTEQVISYILSFRKRP